MAALGVAAVVNEPGLAVAFAAPGRPAFEVGFPLAVFGNVAGLAARMTIDQIRSPIRARILWLLSKQKFGYQN